MFQAGVALPQHGTLPYFMYNSDLLAAQPPPAHMRLAPLQLAAHPGRFFTTLDDTAPHRCVCSSRAPSISVIPLSHLRTDAADRS